MRVQAKFGRLPGSKDCLQTICLRQDLDAGQPIHISKGRNWSGGYCCICRRAALVPIGAELGTCGLKNILYRKNVTFACSIKWIWLGVGFFFNRPDPTTVCFYSEVDLEVYFKTIYCRTANPRCPALQARWGFHLMVWNPPFDHAIRVRVCTPAN